MNQRQQGVGKPGEIPLGDLGLPAVGVPAAMIDGTEDGIRIVGVHERTGAVIDGFTANGHIVRVHNAMDEANQQPVGYQRCLPLCDCPEQGKIPIPVFSQIGKVATDGVVGKRPDLVGMVQDPTDASEFSTIEEYDIAE